MRSERMKRFALPLAALALLTGVLSGCSEASPEAPATPTPTSTPIEEKVDDSQFGEAFGSLLRQGGQIKSTETAACLAKAADAAGLSHTARKYIVDTGGSDYGAIVSGLVEIDADDASVLLSRSLRVAVDACLDVELTPEDGFPDAEYPAPVPATAPEQKEADLTPTVELRDGVRITSANQLSEGLAATLGSYALDDEQAKVYTAASECAAKVVFDAGFSEESLRFLAGGPRVGSGELATYLSVEADTKIWQSAEFLVLLGDCVSNADVSDLDDDGEDTDEDEG